MDFYWHFIEISIKFQLYFLWISIDISLKFQLVQLVFKKNQWEINWNIKWISNGFPLVFHWNLNWILTWYPFDFLLKCIEILTEFLLVFLWNLYWILTEFSTDFHGYFIEISTVFSTKKSIVFIEISIEFFYGFPMDIHYYFQLDFQSILIGVSLNFPLEISTGFSMGYISISLEFQPKFIEISTLFQLDFHYHDIEISIEF